MSKITQAPPLLAGVWKLACKSTMEHCIQDHNCVLCRKSLQLTVPAIPAWEQQKERWARQIADRCVDLVEEGARTPDYEEVLAILNDPSGQCTEKDT